MSTFKDLFEKSKTFFEEHPKAKAALISHVGMAMIGAAVIVRDTKSKDKVEEGIIRCATKKGQRVFEYGGYGYREEEDYDVEIIRKNNPTRTKLICDKYIDWMAQSSMDDIMDSYNESKMQYLE